MSELSVIRYENGMKDQWNSFLTRCKNSLFMFDRNYMDYHSDRFLDHSLVFTRDGEIVALFPANEKHNQLISHGGLTYGGFLVDNEMKQHIMGDCVDSLLDYAKKNNFNSVLYKAIPHVFHKHGTEEDLYAIFQHGGILKEVAASTVINLKCPIKMPKGRKAQINRAKREGVKIIVLDDKDSFTKFINLENFVLENKHNTRAVHSSDELFLLHSRFPKNILLYGAIYEEKLIAGSVIFVYDQAIHTQYMVSDETGRMIGALDLTISTIIENYRDSKDWLDFGISTENHGVFLNQGLISQKESFGGRTNIYTVWEINF